MTLTTQITLQLLARGVNDLDISDAYDDLTVNQRLNWSSGAGANAANQSFRDSASVPASSSATINVTTGSTDAFGAAFNLARVKLLYIRNTGTVDLDLSGENGICGSGVTVIKPGGIVLHVAPNAAGYATSGAATVVLSNNSIATACTFDIVIIGATT